MDSSRFDELTKALATSTSRRQALKTVAAATLGSMLGLAGISTAFAKTCVTNSNGQTCLTPCNSGHSCCTCCDFVKEFGKGSHGDGNRYCTNCVYNETPCNTSADCPQGQFCGGTLGYCATTAC